jgi:hypothetical protein
MGILGGRKERAERTYRSKADAKLRGESACCEAGSQERGNKESILFYRYKDGT